MKKIALLGILIFSFFSSNLSAQTIYPAVNVGYTHFNGNYLSVGLGAHFVSKNDNFFSLFANGKLGYMKDKFIIIPEADLSYNFGFNKGEGYIIYGHYFSVGSSVSPYYIQPKIGFSILSLLKIDVGYNFEIAQHDYTSVEGWRADIGFQLPLQIFE